MNSLSILNVFKLAEPTEGEVGIEIEFEGGYCPSPSKGWRSERDGSLRGNSSEYILRKPCAREDVSKLLTPMLAQLNDEEANARASNNTSVHIHVNVQELTLQQYFNYVFLYMIFEDSLVHYCGERREGNLFCLRSKDAEGLEFIIKSCLKNNEWNELKEDTLRYGAINLNASHRYGSLEFRSMRGTINGNVIERWINLLLKLKDIAMSYTNPDLMTTSFYNKIDVDGVSSFVSELLGDYASIVTDNPSYEEDLEIGLKRAMYLSKENTWVDMVCVERPFFDI